MKPKRLSLYGIWIAVSLAFFLRLYKLNTPLADWHSFRQADTASVAREYFKNGINLFEPKYHDLSNIQSGKDNLEGYRMVEMPIISALVAFTYPAGQLLGWELHVWFRFINIIITLGSTYFLYHLILLFKKPLTAIFSSLIYAILPYNLFYSRTTLPEVSLTFFSLASMYFLIKPTFYKNDKGHFWSYVLGAIFGSLAMLTKPTAIFYIAVSLYVVLRHRGIKTFHVKYLSLLVVLFLPIILWRKWITNFPEGIPVYQWLLNSDGIRLKGAWFRWLFAERLGKLILGTWGMILFGLGFLHLNQNSVNKQTTLTTFLNILRQRFSKIDIEPPHLDRFIYVWGISLISYLIIFATGNVTHDYYQIILIPLVSLIVGHGISYLWSQKNLASYTLLVTSSLLMLAFSWYEVKGYYNINNWAMVEAGKVVDQKIPEDALIIAPYMGDTAFLYQTNRRGWPIGFNIEEKIQMGAEYYVSTSYDDEAKELEQKHQLIQKKDNYLLIKLTGIE